MNSTLVKLRSEGIWWFFSILLSIIILFPIYYFKIPYDFYLSNLLFIIGFFIGLRWLFFWHLTPYARIQILKIALIFLMIPIFFYGIYAFSDFKNFLDEVGIQEILNDIPEREQISMAIYIRSQMVFFSISCLIGILLIPFKLIWNIWKQHNRGKV